MIILWYWNSCTMVFTSQGKFKTTIVVLLQIFTKTKVMYNALTKSTMVLPCYSWKYLGLPWAPGPKERSEVIWSMSATTCLPSHPLRLWHLFSVLCQWPFPNKCTKWKSMHAPPAKILPRTFTCKSIITLARKNHDYRLWDETLKKNLAFC